MRFLLAILTAVALLPIGAWAKDAGKSDPADPASVVPPFNYESTIQRYMPYLDASVVSDWRDTRFDKQAPGEDGMRGMPMPAVPAKPQPPNDGGSSSGHSLHDTHNR